MVQAAVQILAGIRAGGVTLIQSNVSLIAPMAAITAMAGAISLSWVAPMVLAGHLNPWAARACGCTT